MQALLSRVKGACGRRAPASSGEELPAMATCVAMPPSIQHRFDRDGPRQVLTVDLPMLQSLQGVDLDVSSSEVRLRLPGSQEYVHIPVPAELGPAAEEPAAKFSKKKGQLTLTWESATKESKGYQKGPVAESNAATPAPASPVSSTAATKASAPEPVSAQSPSPATAAAAAADVDATDTADDDAGPIMWKDVGDAATEQQGGSTSSRSKAGALDTTHECLEEVQEEIEHLLKQCTVEKLRHIYRLQNASILLDDFSVEGHAYAQKGELRFNVTVDFAWDVMDGIGGMMGVEGVGRISGLCDEEAVQPKVAIRVNRRRQVGVQAKAADWMQEEGAKIIAKFLQETPLAESVLASLDDEDADTAQPAKPAKLHSERDVQKWAEQWFAHKIGSLNMKLFGGLATSTCAGVQLTGNATVSVEREPRFDLELRSSFTVTQQGLSKPCAEGELIVSTFTNGGAAKGATVLFEATPGKKASGQFLTALRKDGVATIRTLLSQFMEDLAAHAQTLPA